MSQAFWQGKNVFLTGHTGFKGGWLSLWLKQLGARVHGYSLNPVTVPSLFDVADVSSVMETDERGDILDIEHLHSALVKANPDIVFHLAAQPLVRYSYQYPLLTFNTNIIGTANLLEVARDVKSIKAMVLVTTDKVYLDNQGTDSFVESDHLGGHDPYSASKAAMELVVSSYRDSFYKSTSDHLMAIATARSGNVIGGGDWSQDRLIPDCLKAFSENKAVTLRNPNAIRPWQHVLEPLAGYIMLAEKLSSKQAVEFSCAWNFGPDSNCDDTVGCVANQVAKLFGKNAKINIQDDDDEPHETKILQLDSSKAADKLNWRPMWNLKQSIEATVSWQHAKEAGKDMKSICVQQINAYERSLND